MVRLAGGWGYDNIGDEAILRGYLDFFEDSGISADVLSQNPARTLKAQHWTGAKSPNVVSYPSLIFARRLDTLLCGGGFLNRGWRGNFERQALQISAVKKRARNFATHSVELNGLNGDLSSRLLGSVLKTGPLSVRDARSDLFAQATGLEHASIQPDAISLLYPSVMRHFRKLEALDGMTVVNFLDIAGRGDSSEAGIEPSEWDSFVTKFIARHPGKVIGLRAGAYDDLYMRKLSIPIMRVKNVSELISVLGSAKRVLSTRMHPALIATQLGVPTVAVPYCAKVSPTLVRLGLESIVLASLNQNSVESIFNEVEHDFSVQWSTNFEECKRWLLCEAFGRTTRGPSAVVLGYDA